MKKIANILLLSTSVILASCALMGGNPASLSSDSDSPGFLESYNLLRPYHSESGVKAWRYINPKFANHNYKAVIVRPAVIVSNPDENSISPEVIANGQKYLQDYTKNFVKQNGYAVVNNSGSSVSALDIIVAGAEVDPVTWKLRKLTSVTSVMGRVTGRIPIESGDDSLLVLEIGGRAIDTQSGLLVGASFVSVPAVKFKDKAGTVGEFESALTPWISQALRNFVESN